MTDSARSLEHHALIRKKRKVKPQKQNSNVDQSKRIDFVANVFSKELVLKTFGYLSSTDLRQCAVVNYQWSLLANDEMLWKPLFYERFHKPRTIPQMYQHNFIQENYQFNQQSKGEALSTYRGSWKLKYKLHRNWLLGHCQISDVYFQYTRQYQRSHLCYLQVLNNTLFINSDFSSVVEIWRYALSSDGSTTAIPICRLQSEVAEENACITHLKLFTQNEGTNYLIAGYSNGGFTIWEITDTTHSGITEDDVREICTYTESISTSGFSNVCSVSLEYPLLTVQSTENISIFFIEKTSVRLIHQLRCQFDRKPMAMYTYRCRNLYGKLRRRLWKLVVCFAVTAGRHYIPTVGIQEFLISEKGIVSSSQSFPDLDRTNSTSPFEPLSFLSRTSSDRVTSFAYSPPHLVVAHANNIIEHYSVTPASVSPKISKLNIFREKVLHGHTYKVEAVSIDSQKQKLISADRSCIKIWDLDSDSSLNVRSHNNDSHVTIPIFHNQADFRELPFCEIRDLDFDEDKIAAIIHSPEEGTSSIRIWSFNS